jgi:hypothetical protein
MPKKSPNSYAPLTTKQDILKELNTITLADIALGIKEGEIIRGVSWGAKVSRWRFFEENLNSIEAGSPYHGGFVARVEVDYYLTYFVLIAWRPAFGKSQDYVRLAKLSHRPPAPIRVDNKVANYFGMKTGDLVEFVARVTFEMDQVSFKIPIASLKLHQHETQGEVEGRAS